MGKGWSRGRLLGNKMIWFLMAALIFRAMPHITLVSGYLFPFFELQIWGILPTTIVVLVAINQPFTAPAVKPLITCLWKNITNRNNGAVAETTADSAHIKFPSC